MQTDSKNSSILIKINGEEIFIPCNCSILKLLESYQINKDRVVIEINKEILKKDLYPATTIKEKDEIEIITFAGGG